MAWYDRILGIQREEKLNPSQYVISRNEGITIDSREPTISYRNAYEQLEIVNRAVNMIVDDVAEIPYTVGQQSPATTNIINHNGKSVLLSPIPNIFTFPCLSYKNLGFKNTIAPTIIKYNINEICNLLLIIYYI